MGVTIALATGHVVGSGTNALAGTLFLGLVVWCFTRRNVGETLALFALYLGLFDGYIKLHTGSPLVTLGRDVLVMAIAGGALLRASVARQRLALPPLGGLVVAFCAIVVVQLLNPGARGLGGGLAGIRQHIEFVPLFFLGFAFIRRESQIRIALVVLVVCAAVGGLVSYRQSLLSPFELASWGPGYAERVLGTGGFANAGRSALVDGIQTVRPFGLGSDAGSGAVIAALALPSLIALLVAGSRRQRFALLLPAAGLALGIATSGARNAVVVAFVSVVAFGLIAARSRNALRAVVGVAIATALIYGAFTQLASNSATKRSGSIISADAVTTYQAQRGGSLDLLGEYMTKHPFGVGIGRAGPAAGTFADPDSASGLNAETEWNFLVLELGVVGLLTYLLINFRLMFWTVTRIRNTEGAALRLYLAALAAPLVGLLAQGFAGATTVSVPGAPYFWFVAGCLSFWLARRTMQAPGRV